MAAKVCQKLFSTGVCNNSSCRQRHDVQLCRECYLVLPNSEAYAAHCRSAKHLKRRRGLSTLLYCPSCDVPVPFNCWGIHCQGRRHLRESTRLGNSATIEPEELTELPGHNYCSTCSMFVRQDLWTEHPNLPAHKRKLRFSRFAAAFDEAAKDKNGVIVSHQDVGLDLGVVTAEAASQGAVVGHLELKLTVPSARISLVEVIVSSRRARRSPFSVSVTPQALVFGRDLLLSVSFSHSYRGSYATRIEIVFEDTSLRQRFTIVRNVKCLVGEQAEYEALKPVAPYKPKKRNARQPEIDVVPGIAPPSLNAIKYITKLPQFLIPEPVSKALSRGSTEGIIEHFRTSLLPSRLAETTYGRHFKYLLWAEEYRSDQDMQVYDIDNTIFRKDGSFYYLNVPGLAEKRPSVLVGDRIMVQYVGADNGRWFEGRVHRVEQLSIALRFGGSFDGTRRVKIRFKFNRIPLRRQHQALDTVLHPQRLLFPKPEHAIQTTIPSPETVRPQVYNRLIANNPAQLQAVASIVNLPAGSPLFVLFGPPGTGKTVTIVEAILQVLKKDLEAHILACAPSNSAADLITQRLLGHLSNKELFRFYAPSRKGQAPSDLREYTCKNGNDDFTVPSMDVLLKFRVIVSTCVSASFAYNIAVPRGHFTHMFIDEAGQATEPEVMISVKTMADNNTNVILSGDPRQLGPIIRSAVARTLGLEKSFLERIMDREAYDELAGYGITVVKLIQNYRSHFNILDFPNRQFYKGELEPRGDPKIINAFLNTSHLVNPKFPVVFHALSGQDDREATSPSFFNILEALQVKEYIQSLKASTHVRVVDEDFGVIAPYHAQCVKIRAALKTSGVRVGSVEEFQGQEKKIIIISTVRSSPDFINYDLKHTLGFVANPRRLNVAITRAKALLIIVGDPTVLSIDPLWRSFLNYIYLNNGWKGDAPTWNVHEAVRETGGYDEEIRNAAAEDMNEFTRRMEDSTLNNIEALNGEAVDDEENADRPWRELE
ncbi:DNA2/NAM7 helicase family protein [Abortiporus biennis]